MGKYFLDSEVFRVEFEDGEWVDVKEELTQEDQDYILNKLAFAERDDGKTKMEYSLGRLSLLERSVIDWSFTDDEGNKIPITSDSISHLRLRYRIKVLDEVNRLVTEANEFTRKN